MCALPLQRVANVASVWMGVCAFSFRQQPITQRGPQLLFKNIFGCRCQVAGSVSLRCGFMGEDVLVRVECMIHFNSFNLLLPGLSHLLPNTQKTQVLLALLFYAHTYTYTHTLRRAFTEFPCLYMGPIELFEGKINNQDKLKGA